ncbi:Uncharacterized protein APZ42_018226 [Daphnia magna]|uniref:Uncharacterized protein n=1 Tax=Daphnia magna TaxID=35525 RepID=A0A164Z8M9_9CRUS|nr:Uncharacterized protein APZ42_018226 [Daphnia magna]
MFNMFVIRCHVDIRTEGERSPDRVPNTQPVQQRIKRTGFVSRHASNVYIMMDRAITIDGNISKVFYIYKTPESESRMKVTNELELRCLI